MAWKICLIKLVVLGGQMQIFENNKISCEKLLPIDKELCYENFVELMIINYLSKYQDDFRVIGKH